jgi:2-dehydropantoate 2-reductase
MTFKRICVYGAGALGSAFAAKIAARSGADTELAVVARGAQLNAIRDNGLNVVYEDTGIYPIFARVAATDDPFSLPVQDLIITGLKGHQLAAAIDGVATLIGKNTRVVMILNGIPWWYFHGDTESGFEGRQIPELDPGSRIWNAIGPERVIGCVAYQGAEIIEPGKTRLNGKGHFFLGEPNGEISGDLSAIVDLLQSCDLDAKATPRIRDEIWAKLRGNAAFNPISALTRGLMIDMMANPDIAEIVRKIINEVQAVGAAFGARFSQTADEMFARAQGFGPVKTSMLQDLLAGKALEIVPLTGMVVALGKLAGVPTPVCDTVFALTVQLDRQHLIN